MTPTAALFRAAGRLEADYLLDREPDSAAILQGTAALSHPIPRDARDAARRYLAIAAWLRSWAVHEDPERAMSLRELADAQDVLAELTLAVMPRMAS